ncbi:hypothetical protein F5B19DRAFT_211544 [Rostrohypoxylon terebratum]|nr:hypothetical protein F5B19DRAFT_211544 [Rostrohypoxylon terebratum]
MSIFALKLPYIFYCFAMIIKHIIPHGWLTASFKKPKPKPARNIDHVESANHGEGPENSTVVMVESRRSTRSVVPPETRDFGMNTDHDDMQDVLAAIEISERDATIEALKQELEQERQACIRVENELNDKLESIKTKWKRAANELDQIRSKPRDFVPVTDEELKNMVTQLRYNIRSFAIQYFSDRPGYIRAEKDPVFAAYIPRLLKSCLEQPETYPSLVQAFIWVVIETQIFNRGRWAGCIAKDYSNLWKYLDFRRAQDYTKSHKDQQNLLIWRARTAILVSASLTEEDHTHARQVKDAIVRETLAVLKLLSDEDYGDEIGNILDDAIRLDKVINSQAAKISWDFGPPPGGDSAEDSPLPEDGEMVVVFPAMIKRGKSNGEDFDIRSVLLPRVQEFCAREKERKA